MKLPKRVTCTKCGHRKKVKWELRDDDVELAAGYSVCRNCGFGQTHFFGNPYMVGKLLEVIEEQDSFEAFPEYLSTLSPSAKPGWGKGGIG